jgi:ubiquinone biosynthesis accessory factor UbiK
MPLPNSSIVDRLNKIAERVDTIIAASPAADLKKNAKQQFIAELAKQGLVTREEYEIQVALLERARAKLVELEAKLAEIEQQRAPQSATQRGQ